MSLKSSYLLGCYFVIGFIILGLVAYMYDSITKTIPDEDKKNDIFSLHRKLIAVFFAPFKYIYLNVKNKQYLALIPFSIFLILLITVLIIGNLMVVSQ